MLENIFRSISKKADQEIKNILQEREKTIFALETEKQRKLKAKAEEERIALLEKVKLEIEDFRQNRETEVKFKIAGAKAEILEIVYQKVIEKLNELPEPKFQKIIAKMVQDLPENITGQILADPKTAPIVKKLFPGPVKAALKEAGFIFESPALEIDCRLSKVLRQRKEEIEPELNKILFKD